MTPPAGKPDFQNQHISIMPITNYKCTYYTSSRAPTSACRNLPHNAHVQISLRSRQALSLDTCTSTNTRNPPPSREAGRERCRPRERDPTRQCSPFRHIVKLLNSVIQIHLPSTNSRVVQPLPHLLVPSLGDFLHFKPLSCIKLHTRENDKCRRGAFALDDLENVFGTQMLLVVARGNQHQGIGGTEAMPFDLRFKGVLWMGRFIYHVSVPGSKRSKSGAATMNI